MHQQLQELRSRELIREMEKGGFVRQVLDEKTGGTGKNVCLSGVEGVMKMLCEIEGEQVLGELKRTDGASRCVHDRV